MWDTWVRSLGWENPPGEAKGYPLQYSGLEKSMECIIGHNWVTFTLYVVLNDRNLETILCVESDGISFKTLKETLMNTSAFGHRDYQIIFFIVYEKE